MKLNGQDTFKNKNKYYMFCMPGIILNTDTIQFKSDER
jgi:hypothetical protein